MFAIKRQSGTAFPYFFKKSFVLKASMVTTARMSAFCAPNDNRRALRGLKVHDHLRESAMGLSRNYSGNRKRTFYKAASVVPVRFCHAEVFCVTTRNESIFCH